MTVLAIAEIRNGALRSVSNEVVTAARQIAGNDEVHVLAIGGPGTAALAAQLAEYGADSILVVEDAGLTRYNPEVAAATIASLTQSNGYRVVLVAASAEGRDLAPRVAVSLDVPLAADVTSIATEGDGFVLTHPVYTGKAIATLRLTANPSVISIRPGAFTPTTDPRAGEQQSMAPASDPSGSRVKVTDLGTRTAKLDLAEAPVIVAGGRGLQAAGNFALLEALADAFGNAAVGATRAVTDDGWRNPSTQIGQTGRLVSPNLYIAVGISGAIQHLAGMRTSRTIVAINKDKDAPIFKIADYGIVGDLFEILPALTEAIATERAGA
jgi:electron transfer flavoprotein alpha subunit